MTASARTYHLFRSVCGICGILLGYEMHQRCTRHDHDNDEDICTDELWNACSPYHAALLSGRLKGTLVRHDEDVAGTGSVAPGSPNEIKEID